VINPVHDESPPLSRMLGFYDHLQVALCVLMAVSLSCAAPDLAGRFPWTNDWVRWANLKISLEALGPFRERTETSSTNPLVRLGIRFMITATRVSTGLASRFAERPSDLRQCCDSPLRM
jgi:hypothetical protein